MEPPRFVADEMVGRLARYLRFVGCDTIYAKGMDDAEIRALAEKDHRVLVTRDRELARRTAGAVLLESPSLADQWSAVRASVPGVPTDVRFDRCSDCNGPLSEFRPEPGDPRSEGIPWDRVDSGLALYRCDGCAHLYWEGTHTEQIRAQIRAWSADGPR